jgi:hypothetical protein
MQSGSASVATAGAPMTRHRSDTGGPGAAGSMNP